MAIGEITKFIAVGFLNTLHYYLLYLSFTLLLNLYYLPAHILAFLFSMVGSFFLNCYLTYQTKPTVRKFVQFPLTYIVNISVTSTAIIVLVEYMRVGSKIAPLLASLVAIPFTFIISRKILKRS